MVGRVREISIWNRPPWVAGATCYGYAPSDAWVRADWDQRLDGRHECQVVATLTSMLRTMALPRRVLVLHTTDGLRMFRIHTTREERGVSGSQLSIQARSLLFDFLDAGLITQRNAVGDVTLAIAGSRTPQQWMQELVLPHMVRQGYTWYTWGGSSSVDPVPLSFDAATPLEVVDAITAAGPFDLRLLDDSGLVYFLTDFGATLVLTQQADGTLRSTARTQSSIEQATATIPLASAGYSVNSRTVARFAVYLNPVSGTTYDVLPLDDTPGATFPVVRLDGQFVDPTGARPWYFMTSRGRMVKILGTATVPGSPYSRATLSEASSWWLGETFELREGLAGTRISVPTPGRPLGISLIASNVLTMTDPLNGSDPVPDLQQIHCQTVLSSLVLAATCSNIATPGGSFLEQEITIPDTTGVLPGHWGFLHNNVGTPWGLYGKVFTVVSVPSGTVLRVRSRYTYDAAVLPLTAGAVAKQLRLYSERTGLHYVELINNSLNQLQLNTAPTTSTTDLLEYALTNAGTTVVTLPVPGTPPDGVSVRDATFNTPPMVRNLLDRGNPYCSGLGSWSTSGGVAVGAGTAFGPGTSYIDVGGLGATLSSLPFHVRAVSPGPAFSVRIRVRAVNAITWTGAVDANVRVDTAGAATVLASVILVPPDHPSPPAGAVSMEPDEVKDIDFIQLDAFAGSGSGYGPWAGFRVVFRGPIHAGGVMPVPDPVLPPQGMWVKQGQQQLWNLGMIQTAANAMTVVSYEAEGVDWTQFLRALPTAPVPGNMVQILDADGDIAFKERFTRIAYHATPEADIRIDIANRRRDFADLLAAKLSQ